MPGFFFAAAGLSAIVSPVVPARAPAGATATSAVVAIAAHTDTRILFILTLVSRYVRGHRAPHLLRISLPAVLVADTMLGAAHLDCSEAHRTGGCPAIDRNTFVLSGTASDRTDGASPQRGALAGVYQRPAARCLSGALVGPPAHERPPDDRSTSLEVGRRGGT
ncbi:hypothetical protein GCM10023107_93230 [Actinoplanes octamycinicus]